MDDAAGGTTLTHYDELGQLVGSTDPDGFTTEYVYDMRGNMTMRRHPDAGSTTYTYDPSGNLTTEVDANGDTVRYLYDFGRVVAKRHSRLRQNDVTYGYGSAGNETGRVASVADASGRQEIFYDEMGAISENIRTFAVPKAHSTYTFDMQFEYDSWNRVTSVTYPDGERVEYAYDRGGNLFSVTGQKDGDLRRYVDSIHYDEQGGRSCVWYGNGTCTQYRYDILRRLDTLRSRTAGGVLMQDIRYGYDSVGNITRIRNAAAAIDDVTLYASPYVVATSRGVTKHYYMGAERFCARMCGGGISNLVGPADSLSQRAGTLYDSCLAEVNGMMKATDDGTCAEGLHEWSAPGFDIDTGRFSRPDRVKVRLSLSAFENQMVLMQDSPASPAEDNVYFCHSDHLGSASWITDNVGSPVQHLQYLPFGEPFVNQRSAGYQERFTFTGKERDAETGFSYHGARYYDADLLTSWTAVDPLADKCPSLSPYAYCAWNPVKLVDPLGAEIAPIYDKCGNFLGTDDQGLKGKAIVMDEGDFTQGMSHEDALRHNLGKDGFQDEIAYEKFVSHYAELKDRPDYDGILTLPEANNWYRNGNGKPIYVDAAKIDLSPVTTGSFEEGEGSSTYINFAGLNYPNPNTGLVYGNIQLTLLDKSTGTVRLGRSDGFLDNYGFEQNPNGSRWRNFATKVGGMVAGKGKPFDIYTYNMGTVWH